MLYDSISMNGGGYGYSIWVVPNNYVSMMTRYNIRHIPHVTLRTNKTLEECRDIFVEDTCDVRILYPSVVFPSMYTNDPLKAVGYYVNIPITTELVPHMTFEYFNKTDTIRQTYTEFKDFHTTISCFTSISDTTNPDPSLWSLIL